MVDKKPIIYRQGRPLFGKVFRGLRTTDPWTLAETYTDNLTTDEYGQTCDPRFRSYDYNHRKD
jgi:hypothetical protein